MHRDEPLSAPQRCIKRPAYQKIVRAIAVNASAAAALWAEDVDFREKQRQNDSKAKERRTKRVSRGPRLLALFLFPVVMEVPGDLAGELTAEEPARGGARMLGA